ncbi:MAG: MFS transporter [Bacteroidales bacterium]|nr:MFS transporter [Bacteroidales bacterium]
MEQKINKNLQYYKFSLYGFLKNLRFYEAFFILFLLSKGVNFIQIGILYSIREITTALLEIPSGFLADSLGRKKTLVTSFLIYILSFALFYGSEHYGILIVAMLFFAVADSFRTGVHKAMIFHYLKKQNLSAQKTNYYGHTRSWSQMGSALSSLIAGVLVFFTGNYKVIFAASVVPYILDMLLVASYPSYLDGETKKLKTDTVKHKIKEVFTAFVLSLKSWTMFRSLTSVSIYTAYYKVIKDYIQPLIVTFALSLSLLPGTSTKQKTAIVLGIVYFFVYLATSYTSRSAGKFRNRFKDYHRPLNSTLIAGLIAGILSGVFYIFKIPLVAVLLFVFILIIENLRKPIGVSFIAEQSHEQAMATVLSVQSQAQSLFGSVIALILGFLVQQIGIGSGIAVTTGLLFLLFPLFILKERKKVI